MYKLFKDPLIKEITFIQRIADNTYIPLDLANTSYQAYLAWVAEGNSPYPADSATPLPAENT